MISAKQTKEKFALSVIFTLTLSEQIMKSILTSLFLLFGLSVFAQNVNVTFQVDMSNESAIPEGVVSIAGSFQDWTPLDGAMTDMGNGIWERTYSIPANTSVQFKFINGTDWPTQEVVPSQCGVNDGFGGFNRSYAVGSEDSTFGPICFGECTACIPEETVEVTFRVNMSNETVSPDGVHVAGDFQDWSPNTSELLPVGDGIYEGVYEVVAGSTVYYKFINGNDWPEQESVPSDCGADDGFGGFNRFLEVGSEPMSTSLVCFGGCYDCDESVPVLVTFQVDMSDEIVSPDGIFMAGSFNDFAPDDLQLTPIGAGVYEGVLVLTPGENITYKFLNGPDFEGSEIVPSDCGVDDGFGGFNRSYTAGVNPESVGPVCFSSCEACAVEESFNLTLRVDMSQEIESSEGVFVAGTFNDFAADATEMTEIEPGIYEVTVEVPAFETTLYKFLNGADFIYVENVPSDCGVDDGFGGYNRAIYVPADSIVDEVCFSSCVACPVGVEEDIFSDVKLFPNPVKDVLNIDGVRSQIRYELLDLSGRIVITGSLSSGLNQIDLSELNSGVYLLITPDGQLFGRVLR